LFLFPKDLGIQVHINVLIADPYDPHAPCTGGFCNLQATLLEFDTAAAVAHFIPLLGYSFLIDTTVAAPKQKTFWNERRLLGVFILKPTWDLRPDVLIDHGFSPL
jgi:hypothetical protein